jgi:hypothetical protein
VTASWQRFRILNASPSRPRILTVCYCTPAQSAGCCCAICDASADTARRGAQLSLTPCSAGAQFRDDTGAEIGSKVCNIIGSDGGTVPYARDHPMPPTGLMVEVAYRWDVICDFSNYTNSVRSCLFLRTERLLVRATCAGRCRKSFLPEASSLHLAACPAQAVNYTRPVHLHLKGCKPYVRLAG